VKGRKIRIFGKKWDLIGHYDQIRLERTRRTRQDLEERQDKNEQKDRQD
jgi:hypothetical protein